MKDALGDRMKLYERLAEHRLIPGLPIIARIDGRRFSKFTRGLTRPYDARLSSLMLATTQHLVTTTEACCGYTQSDEITLAWYERRPTRQTAFAGRVSKLVSTLAAEATVSFNCMLPRWLPTDYRAKWPTFDARVWNVPSLAEAANVFLWREWDATKNSISMAARHYYSYKEVHGKSSAELQEMLHQRNVNWNDYPIHFKRGVYVRRRDIVVNRRYTTDEFAALPAKHHARSSPNYEFQYRRTVTRVENWAPLAKIGNRVDVLFCGAEVIPADEPLVTE